MVGDTGIEPVTSSVSRKRASPCANRPLGCFWVLLGGACSCDRGGDGIRTRVRGFAGRCLASRPLHHEARCCRPLRADDGIRTRDPHLGKVMRYQLRYVRIPIREGPTLTDTPTSCAGGLGIGDLGAAVWARAEERGSPPWRDVGVGACRDHDGSSRFGCWRSVGCCPALQRRPGTGALCPLVGHLAPGECRPLGWREVGALVLQSERGPVHRWRATHPGLHRPG